jgi:hypothetical protein
MVCVARKVTEFPNTYCLGSQNIYACHLLPLVNTKRLQPSGTERGN